MMFYYLNVHFQDQIIKVRSKFYTHKTIGNIAVLYILSFFFMEVECKKILDRTAVGIL